VLVPFPFVTRGLLHGVSLHFPVLVDAFGLPPSDASCVLSRLVAELLPHAFPVPFSFSLASSSGLCELAFHASAVAGASCSWEGGKKERGDTRRDEGREVRRRGKIPGGTKGGR